VSISDASRLELEDGQVVWALTLHHDRLHRHIDGATGKVRYSLEDILPEQGGEHQLIRLLAEGSARGLKYSSRTESEA